MRTAKTDQTADALADLGLRGAHVILLVLSCCGSFINMIFLQCRKNWRALLWGIIGLYH